MKKLLLPLTAGLSSFLAILTGEVALSEQNSLTSQYPRANNPETYKPVCYMRTDGGAVLNLESVCESDNASDIGEEANNNPQNLTPARDDLSTENPVTPMEQLPPQEETPSNIEITPDGVTTTDGGIEVQTETDMEESDTNIPIREGDGLEESDTNIPIREGDGLEESGTNIPIREGE
ncbi:MAG: hypothetical protein SXA11_14810 [Cyanobacteriota bacterium]|nr:hypothetical protein [Cyanobacteriota bacterium]